MGYHMSLKTSFQRVFFSVLALMAVAHFSGCQVMRGESTISQYSDDSAITARVKTKLVRSDQVSASRVTVETNRGVVLLSGFVQDQHQADVATSIARSVSGVASVRNRLVVS